MFNLQHDVFATERQSSPRIVPFRRYWPVVAPGCWLARTDFLSIFFSNGRFPSFFSGDSSVTVDYSRPPVKNREVLGRLGDLQMEYPGFRRRQECRGGPAPNSANRAAGDLSENEHPSSIFEHFLFEKYFLNY